MQLLGKEISADAIGNTGYREGVFATWNDPAKFGLFYHASLIMRRGDVSVAKNRYTVRVDDLSGNDYGQFRPRNVRNAFFASAERSQIGADYYGEYPDTIPDSTVLVEKTAGEVRSDTGELYRSWEKRYGTVDSPMSKAIYGRLSRNGTIALNGLTVRCKTITR